MPLSEHEKRLLDQIEQTLHAEDPGLASSLRSARPQPRNRTLIMVAVVSLLIGFGLIFIGLRLNDAVGTVLGVLGYLLLVGCGEAVARVLSVVRQSRTPRRRTAGEASAT
jgi:DUF3040 family protein